MNPAITWFMTLVVVLGVLFSSAAADEPSGRPSVLFIGKQPDHPYGSHMYLHTCRMLGECLRLNGLDASVSDGWPKHAVPDGVKTIVVYTSPGAELLLDGPHRDEFLRLMQQGVGLVTIHWASSVLKDDLDRLGERWIHCLGGTWVSNVGLNTDTAELKQLIPKHPICRGWSNYELHDEYYLNPTISKDARPLLQVTTKGQDVVVGWAYERPDGGRAYGTTLGHFYSNFEREPFRRAVVNAILWTAHREVPEAGARVDVGDDFLKLPPERTDKPPAAKTPDPARADGAAQRVLRFPTDRAVGTVYWRMPDGKPYVYAMYADSWKPIGRTRGTVRLPAQAEVRLDVGKAASRDLAWLDDLGPNDIQAINLRNTDVRDEALGHVTRLTGLRAIDLQCARISGGRGAVRAVSSLPD